jgi:hypothetical protein
MDYQALDFWWKVGITVMNAGVWLYLYLLNRNRVTNERINRMETHMTESIGTHGTRLTRLESDAKHAPKPGDLARLHQRIDDVAGSIKRIEGENSAQTRILNLVYESLVK